MSNTEKLDMAPGMPVIFKNLLEEKENDICCGIIQEDGYIACGCGCNGIFETEDVQILDYYGDADFIDVHVYSMRDFVSELLPALADGQIVTFSSSGDTGCNFGIGFHNLLDTKVLLAGYWGGCCEDETGIVKLFNYCQNDIQSMESVQKDVAEQVSAMVWEIDEKYRGFVFVTPQKYSFDGKQQGTVTITEWCSKCGMENTIEGWDVEKEGLTAYCPHCGSLMMLCSECERQCSWDSQSSRCQYTTGKKTK